MVSTIRRVCSRKSFLYSLAVDKSVETLVTDVQLHLGAQRKSTSWSRTLPVMRRLGAHGLWIWVVQSMFRQKHWTEEMGDLVSHLRKFEDQLIVLHGNLDLRMSWHENSGTTTFHSLHSRRRYFRQLTKPTRFQRYLCSCKQTKSNCLRRLIQKQFYFQVHHGKLNTTGTSETFSEYWVSHTSQYIMFGFTPMLPIATSGNWISGFLSLLPRCLLNANNCSVYNPILK